MKVDGKHYRTIWLNHDGWSVAIIDQTKFPFRFETVTLAGPGGTPRTPFATCWYAARR